MTREIKINLNCRCTTTRGCRLLWQGMVRTLPHDTEQVCDTHVFIIKHFEQNYNAFCVVGRTLYLALKYLRGVKCGRILCTSFLIPLCYPRRQCNLPPWSISG